MCIYFPVLSVFRNMFEYVGSYSEISTYIRVLPFLCFLKVQKVLERIDARKEKGKGSWRAQEGAQAGKTAKGKPRKAERPWFQDPSRKPTTADLAELCGFATEPVPGDRFRTRGEKGTYGPVCKEYTDKADAHPRGRLLGTLPAYTLLTAIRVEVALIPEDRHRRKPPEWGIAIVVESYFAPGTRTFVNVSRAGTQFARLESAPRRGQGGQDQGKYVCIDLPVF